MKNKILIAIFLITISTPAFAEEDIKTGQPEKLINIANEPQKTETGNVQPMGPTQDIRAVPPILDPYYRHKKKGQFELSPYGGSYLGEAVDQTWLAGFRQQYFLNNTYSIGTNFAYSRLSPDQMSSFGSIMKNNNMYIVNAEGMINNDMAMRVGKSLVEVDMYATLGMGVMGINDQWEPMGVVGGGVKIYPWISWLAFRIDVNNYIHPTHKVGSTATDFDVSFLGGISFLLPVRPSAYETKQTASSE